MQELTRPAIIKVNGFFYRIAISSISSIKSKM